MNIITHTLSDDYINYFDFISYLESKGITLRDFIKANSKYHYKDIKDSKEFKEWLMNKKLAELENDFRK